MLSHIHIHNLGIISDVEINFENGFNVLTGETGAGKTLIIGAISMILGGKVSKDIIRTGENSAFVEAMFYIESKELKAELSNLGISDDELVIYREILTSGKGVTKINGHLVTINQLKEVGKLLVDLHGQHDNQSLLNSKNHIVVLDNFARAKLADSMGQYINLYERRKNILDEIDRMGGNPEQRARTIEFLKFQIDEIANANLKIDEDIELAEKKKVLASAEKVMATLGFSHDAITSENGVLSILQKVIQKFNDIESIKDEYKNIGKLLNEAYYQLEEVGYSINSEESGIYIDEEELNQIEERLDVLFKLKKKYGSSIADVLNMYEKLNKEYLELCNSESILDNLNSELIDIESRMRDAGRCISKIRKEVASELEAKLASTLASLEMPKSRFEIKVQLDESTFLRNGMDSVEILFSSNSGEDVKELSRTASGGEISRIMLALKNVLVNADIIPVMIFDEIDTGISGRAGNAVGEMMRKIASQKQVICVTHLPSIAAKGMANFFIAKETVGDKTETRIRKLDEEETVREIARIIGGGNISEVALQHAREIRNW